MGDPLSLTLRSLLKPGPLGCSLIAPKLDGLNYSDDGEQATLPDV